MGSIVSLSALNVASRSRSPSGPGAAPGGVHHGIKTVRSIARRAEREAPEGAIMVTRRAHPLALLPNGRLGIGSMLLGPQYRCCAARG